MALSHYLQLRKMNKDVKFFYRGGISAGWKQRLETENIGRIPTGITRSPKQLRNVFEFLKELREFDRILVHHHVEPLLAFYLTKAMGPKTVWYSGSVFELAWEKEITGLDYREISSTVRRTGNGFYGSLLSEIALSDALFGLTARLAKVFDAETVRGYRKIIANSLFLSKFLQRVYHLRETPTVVYPAADPLLEELATANNPFEADYMLGVGSLIPLKNVDGMIRAAAKVRTSKIVIVGEGQELSKLKDLGSRLKVPVEFKGTMNREEDLAEVYRACKFLVHLSLYEPFGLTPLEAGLFSKPSIVTNRGGPPEVVKDGVTGFIVDPRDYALIGSRMHALLRDEELRHEMGKHARENILQKFTMERSTMRLWEELEKL